MRLIRIYTDYKKTTAPTHPLQETRPMTPGIATLLTSLGLILIAMPWVLGVQRTNAAQQPDEKALPPRS